MNASNGSIEQVWPAFPLQQGLLFHGTYAGDGEDVYSTTMVLALTGQVDEDRLRAACAELVRRHQTLRAGFHTAKDGRTVQVVRADAEAPWRQVDLRAGPDRLDELLAEARREPFDFTDPPLLRWLLVRLEDVDGVPQRRFALTFHHIVLDGWSIPLLLGELAKLYDGTPLGPPPSVEPYVAWLHARDRDAARARWRAAMAGLAGPTLLTRAAPGPSAPRPRSVTADLPAGTTAAVRARGFTVSTLLQAGWGLLLGVLTGRADVVFGMVVSGRPPEVGEVGSMIGLFINTVPVRVRADPADGAAELLARVQLDRAELTEHEHLPLAEIQDAVGLGGLFDTLLVYENYPVADEGGPGEFTVDGGEIDDASHYPVNLIVLPGAEPRLKLNFDERRFTAADADRLLARLGTLLGALARGESTVGELTALDPADRAVIERANATDTPIEHRDLASLVAATVAARPDAVAVADGCRELTYAELDAEANRLAHLLIARGVGTDVHVASLLPRSADAVVTALAVAKAGGALVPIDIAYPARRVEFLLADSAPALVVTTSAVPAVPVEDPILLDDRETARCLAACPATAPAAGVPEQALAYVIYTSGSTGRPKGVADTQLAATEYASWAAKRYPGLAGAVLLHSPLTFDLTVTAVWGTLAAGGRIQVADLTPDLTPEPSGFTFVKGTPSHLPLIDAVPDLLAPQADLVLGGEQLYGEALARLGAAKPGVAVTVEYGPTEITVAGVAGTFLAAEAPDGIVPIGVPIANTRVFVLSDALRPVPPGVIGEVYVAGTGVSRGYLGRPRQTAERFVARPGPGGAGERVYRTGDLARWDHTGALVFVGRADNQVKIRGHRVEPDEIEALASAFPAVSRAAVTVVAQQGDDGVRHAALACYLQPSDVDIDAVREFLRAELPDYLVPSFLVPLAEFPVTPNNKIDRAALPAPWRREGQQAPSTATERLLCELLAGLLAVETVGRDDDFFALGGDSIVSIQLVSRARKRGLSLRSRDVFETPIVADLAAAADARTGSARAGADEPDTGAVSPTPALAELLERQRLTGADLMTGFQQSVLLSVPAGLAADSLRSGISAVIARHDALRLRLGDDSTLVVRPPGSVRAEDVLRVVDATEFTEEDLRAAVETAHSKVIDELSPADGALMRLVWFDRGPRRQGCLLWTVHHLAVDGVSWRILVPDLAAAAEGARLDAVGTSLRAWARMLGDEARSDARVAELDAWRAILTTGTGGLRGGSPRQVARRPAGVPVVVSLDVATTETVLTAIPAALRCGPADVLLAAFAAAVSRWRGDTGPVLTEVEGHGRTELTADVDLSRTVGWFTSQYPVLVGGAAGPALLRAVKEQVRAVPGDGLGFGLLRYLNDRTAGELAGYGRPDIGFNYLGRFRPENRAGDWSLVVADDAEDPAPPPGQVELWSPHLLDLTAAVRETADGACLVAEFGWAADELTEDDVTAIATGWRQALLSFARDPACLAAARTPSDFPLVEVTEADLDRLTSGDGTVADLWPLAPLQRGLMFHALFDEDALDVYTSQFVLEFTGPVDPARLRAACEALVARHPSLRAGFEVTESGELVQVVRDGVGPEWTELDRTGLPDPREELASIMSAERARGFDLARPPLTRFVLVSADDGVSLLWTFHHAVADGWSMPLLLRDLRGLYAGAECAPAPSYRDYLTWLTGRDRAAATAAWAAALRDLDGPTLLAPGAPTRPVAPETITTRMPAWLPDALADTARSLGCTVNTLAQVAFALVLQSMTGRGDIVFGTVVSGRPPEVPGVEEMTGLFINTVPVRIRPGTTGTLAELARRVHAEQAGLAEHQYLSLAEVQAAAGERALFDTVLLYENYPVAEDSPDAVGLDELGIARIGSATASHYPLTVIVEPRDGMALRLDYRPDLFPDDRVREWADRLLLVLEQIAARPATPIAKLTLLRPAGRALLDEWAGRKMDQAATAVPDLFRAQVARTPDTVALQYGGSRLSYAELEARARGLASALGAAGAGPEQRVAVLLPASSDAVIAMLATWFAGAAYVPIEPGLPAQRIEYLMRDAAPACVVTTAEHRASVPTGLPVLDPGHSGPSVSEMDREVPVDALAYVLYTSGTTGNPKGVQIGHAALASYVGWARTAYLGATGTVPLHSTPSVDLTVTSVFVPLCAGGTVLAGPLEETAKGTLGLVKATPSHLPLLDATEGYRLDGELVLGGEALHSADIAAWRRAHPTASVVNEYGPTECTVGCVAHRIPADAPVSDGGVPIGTPIDGTRVLVLDAALRPVPPGAVGELYLDSPGLARGYHGRPALTASRFVAHPDPHRAGDRMYRTGDLATWREDGELACLGRTDDQVKVKGFRVELGEIDAVLGEHPAVRRAVSAVQVLESGARVLTAYVQPAGGAPGSAELAAFAATRLPAHMVPSVFVPMPELPLTVAGKVDRTRLPVPGTSARSDGGRAPATPTERMVAELFGELLGLDEVAATDDFFALGGDSIVTIRLAGRARRLGVRIRPKDVFEFKTVAAIAAAVDRAPDPVATSDGRDGTGMIRPTPIMRALADGGDPSRLFALEQSVVLGTPAGLTEEDLIDAVRAVLGHHDVLRAAVVREPDGWALHVPEFGGTEAKTLVRRVDVSYRTGERVTAALDAAHQENLRGLDPGAGRMMALAWLDAGPAEPGCLLWTVSHLVVDTVSWRILAEDLGTAYRGLALVPVGTSFRRWSELLAETGRTAETALWSRILDSVDEDWLAELAGELGAGGGSVRVELDARTTEVLLGAAPSSVHGTVDDVLLSALAVAVATVGEAAVAVELEGHGREEFAEDIDLSRTVGWFTTAYPVVLDARGTDITGFEAKGAAVAVLKDVKEQLREIPDHGLGFGVLRHLTPSGAEDLGRWPMPKVSFNYLGRFGARGESTESMPEWQILPSTFAEGEDGHAPSAGGSPHALSVLCMTIDGDEGPRLVADWRYDGETVGRDGASRLGGLWRRALTAIAADCAGIGTARHTPSDVDLVEISADELAEFELLADAERGDRR